MTAETDRAWFEEIGLADDIETHEVEAETFARVHYHTDGTVTFDEGWRAAFIESDTLYQLEDWR